jgi:hypothetical protein
LDLDWCRLEGKNEFERELVLTEAVEKENKKRLLHNLRVTSGGHEGEGEDGEEFQLDDEEEEGEEEDDDGKDKSYVVDQASDDEVTTGFDGSSAPQSDLSAIRKQFMDPSGMPDAERGDRFMPQKDKTESLILLDDLHKLSLTRDELVLFMEHDHLNEHEANGFYIRWPVVVRGSYPTRHIYRVGKIVGIEKGEPYGLHQKGMKTDVYILAKGPRLTSGTQDVCLSISPSLHPSIHPSIHPSTYHLTTSYDG